MKNSKGISLIVLVITIIVMIILAGSIILTLSNNGIIGKASEAVEESDAATVNQLAQMAWAESYAEYKSGPNNLTEEALVAELEKDVIAALEDNKVNTAEYGIIVTTEGVDIIKGWIQSGTMVKKGTTILTVGDPIDYKETAGDGLITWKVLGASDKGELLILSTQSIATISLSETGNISKAKSAYINGVSTLNEICEPYGKGVGVSGKARCIKVEDINKVTGYKPEIAKWSFEGNGEYGRSVTYTWNGGTKPNYAEKDGLSGTSIFEHNGAFIYYADGKFETSTNEGATEENPKHIITAISTKYGYYPTTLTGNENDEKIGLGEDTEAYKMLFNGVRYWLASPYIFAARSNVVYGYSIVYDDYTVSTHDFLTSYGTTLGRECDVRAVVPLAGGIQIKELSANGWTYSVK